MKINLNKNITDQDLKFLENKLINKEFKVLENIIENLSKKNFDHPAIKIIYASSKSMKPNSSLNDQKIAFDLFIEVYKSNPNYIQALYNACTLSFKINEFEKISILLEKFIENNKFDEKIYEAAYKIKAKLGDVNSTIRLLKVIVKRKSEDLKAWSALLFSLLYSDKYNQKDYFSYSQEFYKNIKNFDKSTKEPITCFENKKIQLAFMTPYFNGNSIDGFIEDLLKNIDRDVFEITAFNLNNSDINSNNLKGLFDKWFNVLNLSDLELLDFIRNKKTNILIDLVGHGPGNRLAVFKNRAAPIQISWLGFCNTTGLKEIDYIIVDPHVVKKNEQVFYSEKFLILPSIWNSHREIGGELKINSSPFKQNKFFTFGSFNNFKKISKSVVEVWSEILNKTNARLILKSSMNNREDVRKIILNKFSKNLVNSEKIQIFAGQRNKFDHLNMYNQVDLSLDTFPYNGVTTSFEAIWMGVPVLTLKGSNFISRCGESINTNLGLNSFIAENKEDYIRKAINFSNKTEIIEDMRKNLREYSKKSILFQTKKFTDEFSIKLKELWLKKIS